MPTLTYLDETRMKAVFAAAEPTAETILRLARQAGLRRQEIWALTWGQVDLMEWRIHLPDRTVPMDLELAMYLLPLSEGKTPDDSVAASRRSGEALTPQTISHLARAALTAAGETEVSLADLRSAYAAARLAAGEGWQSVSRLTGMSAAALRRLGEETRSRRTAPPAVKSAAIEELIRAEGTSPAGLAIALAWRCGLGLEEIAALRWSGVEERVLEEDTKALLESIRPAEDGFVLSTRTGKPYDLSRLSRLVRDALVRRGLDDVTLRDLRRLRGAEDVESALLRLAADREGVTLRRAREELGGTDTALRRSFKRLTDQGKLTRVGLTYYLPAAVVPPGEQEAAVLEHLRREGFAYRQDIARLLRITPAQCRPLLGRLVEAGKVRLENQRYTLL